MFNFLAKARNKPEEDKRKILVKITIFIMIIIIVIWFFLSNINQKEDKNDNSSLRFITEHFFKLFGEMGSGLKEIKNEFSGSLEK